MLARFWAAPIRVAWVRAASRARRFRVCIRPICSRHASWPRCSRKYRSRSALPDEKPVRSNGYERNSLVRSCYAVDSPPVVELHECRLPGFCAARPILAEDGFPEWERFDVIVEIDDALPVANESNAGDLIDDDLGERNRYAPDVVGREVLAAPMLRAALCRQCAPARE